MPNTEVKNNIVQTSLTRFGYLFVLSAFTNVRFNFTGIKVKSHWYKLKIQTK